MDAVLHFFLNNGIGQNIVAWVICGGLGFTAGTFWAKSRIVPHVKHHLELLTELHQHHLPHLWDWFDDDEDATPPAEETKP